MAKETGLIIPPASSMRLLSWKCWDTCKASTVKALKALVRDEGPDIIFLSETKVSSPRIDRIKHNLGFANFYCVDSEDRAGDLALFWKLGVEMEVVFTNKNMMAYLVYSDPSNTPWLLIAVHGPPYLIKRKKFWELMESIISGFSGHWLLIGDLNSISLHSKKSRGSSKGKRSSRSFRNFISNMGAIYLGFSGPKYTWSNRRVGWANIRERLDRGLCNADWQSLFPKVGVRHLTTPNSDHNPILLDTHLELSKGSRPFSLRLCGLGRSLVLKW